MLVGSGSSKGAEHSDPVKLRPNQHLMADILLDQLEILSGKNCLRVHQKTFIAFHTYEKDFH